MHSLVNMFLREWKEKNNAIGRGIILKEQSFVSIVFSTVNEYCKLSISQPFNSTLKPHFVGLHGMLHLVKLISKLVVLFR